MMMIIIIMTVEMVMGDGAGDAGDSDGGSNYGDGENDSSADILKWNGTTNTNVTR